MSEVEREKRWIKINERGMKKGKLREREANKQKNKQRQKETKKRGMERDKQRERERERERESGFIFVVNWQWIVTRLFLYFESNTNIIPITKMF